MDPLSSVPTSPVPVTVPVTLPVNVTDSVTVTVPTVPDSVPVTVTNLPVTLPVNVPDSVPVNVPTVPVTLPVNVPDSVPVTVPTVPVTLPVNVPDSVPVNVPTVPDSVPVNVPTVPVPVPTDLSNFTITEPGVLITGDHNGIQLITTDPAEPKITEIFQESVVVKTIENPIVQQIKLYAEQIKCEDFHGKGTIDDYTLLFEAASKIANDTKQVQLDIDIQGFNEFGKAADDLSALFTSFTKKIQSVNIIDDSLFLSAVLSALKKIVALSKAFGTFQESILVTNTIELSSSIGETKKILEGVSEEVACAMGYINHFSSPTEELESANLNAINKNAISRACTTIDAWNNIYKNGVSMAMNENTDIQYIKRTNQTFIQQSAKLRISTNIIRERYSYYF